MISTNNIASDTFYVIRDFNYLVDLLMIADIELLIMKSNKLSSQFAITNDSKTLFIILFNTEYVIQLFPTGISHG